MGKAVASTTCLSCLWAEAVVRCVVGSGGAANEAAACCQGAIDWKDIAALQGVGSVGYHAILRSLGETV